MVICPDCGMEVRDAKFCSNCGSLLPQNVDEKVDESVKSEASSGMVVCPDCGMEVKDEKFCSNCGALLHQNVDEKVDESVKSEASQETILCPNCGIELDSHVVVCPDCGFNLTKKQEDQQDTKFCQHCGKKIKKNAEFCPYCGFRASVTASHPTNKNVALALILSFILPGVGQLYIGQSRKGISFIAAYFVSLLLTIILIGFLLVFVVWIWSLVDAAKSATALNNGEYVEDKLF